MQMMSVGRINLYDNMKAIAIILVVIGHINEFSLGGYNSILYHFYDSFHMSIFFFVSGLFLFKKFDADESIFAIAKKIFVQCYNRSLQLLLPFVIVGMLYCYSSQESIFSIFDGNELRFWFLPSLCIDIFIVYAAYFIFRCLNVKHIAIKCIMAIGVWLCCYALTIVFNGLKDCHYYMMAIRNLPFLGFGILYNSVSKMKKWISDERVLASCFMSYVLFFIWCSNWFQMKWGGYLVIPMMIYICSRYESSIPKWFTKIGRSTLAIYVFHYFLLPNIPLAEYMKQNLSQNIVIYILASLLLTVPIIVLCMCLEKIIDSNRYLKLLIWFKKTK